MFSRRLKMEAGSGFPRYLDMMRLAYCEGWHSQLLSTLDSVALELASTPAGPLRQGWIFS